MNKLYERIIWHNNTTPALNETNLNLMSKAINDIDDRVVELGGDILEKVPEIEETFEQVEELSQNPPYIGANGHWYTWDTSTGAYVDSGVDASITIGVGQTTTLSPGSNATVTNSGTDTDPVFNFGIPKGEKGDTGSTPDITMSASADAVSSANPSVQVTKGGTAENPTFSLSFSGLKGAKGDTGNTGATPSITAQATVDSSTGTPSVTVTKSGTDENPVLTFAFHNLKGADGQGSGDMTKAVYDSDNDVAAAGGIKAFIQSLGYITGLAWSALTNKPFSTVGSGLSISNDELSANVQSVSVDSTGTASASAVRYQRIGVNGVYTDIDGTKYMEQTITTSTSADVTATFSNAAITTDSVIEDFYNVYGISASNIVTTTGQCVVTIPKQSTAFSLGVRIYIR